ncbi:hypothetical protein D3C83_181260 [compost metagenome]
MPCSRPLMAANSAKNPSVSTYPANRRMSVTMVSFGHAKAMTPNAMAASPRSSVSHQF